MKRLLLMALILACARPDSVQPARDQPPVTRDLNVRLELPREGDVIRQNPIVVRGQARTFENNVDIRVLDANQQLLVETFSTATGDIGTFNPFEREVFLTRDPGPRLTVQAFEYSAKDGSVQHLNSVTVPAELRMQEVKLYFPSSRRSPQDCSMVYPEQRSLPGSISAARLLVEALIAGPATVELDSPFPRGSAVRSVNLRDGVLTVDFNERLQNVGGSCPALAIRAAVTRTLSELPNVRQVRITAFGREETALQP